MSKITLFRGERYGVFSGANGYYIAPMASGDPSHYQPIAGSGWGEETLRSCNAEALLLEQCEYLKD